MAYSMDLRERVAADHAKTGSSARTAEKFGVSESWVRRLTQRLVSDKSLEPRSSARRDDQRAYGDEDEKMIRRLIEDKPDMTLKELIAAVGKKAGTSTMSRTLARLGLVRKKSRCEPQSRTARTWHRSVRPGPRGSRSAS